MPRKISSTVFVILVLIVMFAWSPWLAQSSAQTRAVDTFRQSWESVADGCGINCKGCGAVSSQRIPFGVLVTIEYACGLIPADVAEYHRQATAFVSPLGTVHGLPKP